MGAYYMGINTINVNSADTNYAHSIFDISEYNSGAKYDNLSQALSAVPQNLHKGGMTVAFVQNSDDNKYVQYRLMTDDWSTTVGNWQQIVSYESLYSHVFTNDAVANKLIKELYLYKPNGTPINEQLYIQRIGKNTPLSSYYYYLVIKNSNNTVAAWIAETISSNVIEVELTARNSSGITGKAILDFSKIDEGKYEYDFSVKVLESAYNIICSPFFSGKDGLQNLQNELENKLEDNIIIDVPGYKDITNEAIITYDKYLKNDGTTIVDGYTSFRIAELPLDEEVQAVSVTGTHFAAGATLVFKDSNENIIGNVITVSSTQYGTITANKPQGATKAYTTYRDQGSNDEPINFVISIVTKETVKEEIIKAKINDYQSLEDKSIDIGLVQGSANTADGGIAENTNFGKTDKIDISQYDFVRIYNRFSNNICYTKWFNDNNEEVLPRGIGDGTSDYKYATFNKPDGATQVEISIIDWYEPKYIDFGKNSNTVASDENGLLQQVDILSLPNVSMIPIFGQSLSVGAAAVPPISKQCKYPAGIMFATGIGAAKKAVSYFTEFAPLQEHDVETVASGCLEQLIELIQKENGINAKSKFWNDHKFLFVTCGAGSTTIAMLMENYYQGLLNAVQGGKNVANNKGWTFDVPAVIYIQGETDQKPTNATPYATYKAALQNFATTFNTDVKQITGQKKDVKVIMYQTCSQNYWFTPTFANYAAMDIPTAQMDLINEEPNFCACNPAYMLDHSTVEHIHLSAVGEKMMGLYCGISLKQLLVDNFKFKGLTLNNYAISGNNITLELNVQCPPLRIDTQFVKEVSNYGFKVVKSDDSDILSSVSVYDKQIILICSESPVGCKLYYGFNGTAGYDGRKEGSRGNICDSGDYIYNGEIGGSKYLLRNYLYAFCVSLS